MIQPGGSQQPDREGIPQRSSATSAPSASLHTETSSNSREKASTLAGRAVPARLGSTSLRRESPAAAGHAPVSRGALREAVVRGTRELSSRLGRAPFPSEVREHLARRGLQITTRRLLRTLSSARKARRAGLGATVKVGSLLGAARVLRREHRAILREQGAPPSREQLRERAGWTKSGFDAALPLVQDLFAEAQSAPLLLADTSLGVALGDLELLRLRVLGPLLRAARDEKQVPLDHMADMSSMLQGWDLPPLPLRPERDRISIDDALLRCEMWWVQIVCMHAPPREFSPLSLFAAQSHEAEWARRCGVADGGSNPFKGFAHVLSAACLVGRLDTRRFDEIVRLADQLEGTAATYAMLRREVRELAFQCGFPKEARVR